MENNELNDKVKMPVSEIISKCRRKSRRMCSHLLQELQNYNSLLNSHQQENVGFHQKKIPHSHE